MNVPSNRANGIKYLHSQGNYDFTVDINDIHGYYFRNTNNILYNFIIKGANPYSGQSRWENIRYDYNNDSIITYEQGCNDGGNQEHRSIVMLDGEITNEWFGINAAFNQDTKLKLNSSSNPPLVNYPKFNGLGDNLTPEPYILNGIEVKIVSENSDSSITVRVSKNRIDIDSNFRFAGKEIILLNIMGSGNTDLQVMPYCTLLINRSETPNRTVKVNGSFTYPTNFNCLSGSRFYVSPNGRVELRDSTTLALYQNSKLIVDSGAVVWVECGSRIVAVESSNIELLGTGNNKGKIIYESGCIVDTMFYDVTLCRKKSNGSFKPLPLKVSNIHFNAHWFLGLDTFISSSPLNISPQFNTPYLDSFDISGLISNYLDSLDGEGFGLGTVDKVYLHFLLFDGTLHRWMIDINYSDNSVDQYYADNPNIPFTSSNVIVRPDGASATVFFNAETATGYDKSIGRLFVPCGLSYASHILKKENISLNGFSTSYFSGDHHLIHYVLDEGECYASITMVANCYKCPEIFTFHIFNQDLLVPPTLEVIKACSGGAIIKAKGGNNCGDLESRWVKMDKEKDTIEKIETGKNPNSVNVSEAGFYRLEYFHSNDSNTVIYASNEIEVKESNLLAEPILTVVDAITVFRENGNGIQECYFEAKVYIENSINAKEYDFNLSLGSDKVGNWQNEDLGSLDIHLDTDSVPYLLVNQKIDCFTREVKITIVKKGDTTGTVLCEQIFPVDCECHPCDLIDISYSDVRRGFSGGLPHKLPWMYTHYPYPVWYDISIDTEPYNAGDVTVKVLSNESDAEPHIEEIESEDDTTIKRRFSFMCSGGRSVGNPVPLPPFPVIPILNTYDVSVEVCVNLDKQTDTCCDTTTLTFYCIGLLRDGGVVNLGGRLGIFYKLFELPDFSTPLNIAIYDHKDDKVMDVMSVEPTKLSDTFYLNSGSLSAGSYHAVFQLHNQIAAVPFTIEGIIKSVNAVPNPALHGNTTINYVFNRVPAGGIKVSITDLHGIERLVIHNGIVHSLAGSFAANVNSLPAGYYLIKFEAIAEKETVSITFIKQ